MTKRKAILRALLGVFVVLVLISIPFISEKFSFVKLYPVLVNGIMLCVFGGTFLFPPVMIFRFAVAVDKSIKGSPNEKRVEVYCRKVTLVWCCFFAVNGSIALVTALWLPNSVWALYNGCIAYIAMGLLFAGELVVRKKVDARMPKYADAVRAVPLSQFTWNSHDSGAVVCYDGDFSLGARKTWADFLADTAKLRRVIHSDKLHDKWLLHADDCWYFLTAFTALLQCGKHVLLTANTSAGYLAEIMDDDTVFLTDEPHEGALNIAALLEAELNVPDEEARANFTIHADETRISLYTSGSTGEPKAVQQRLTEFENDNAFILSVWGDEWRKRAVCSTVSQHHIYGLLFSIMLPFTAGVPFRRRRVEFPEELFALCSGSDSYMIITVPAFLKRVCEVWAADTVNIPDSDFKDFNPCSPFIFTSGGAVPFETAKQTADIFGCWPLEVYGSTETSGIAWRQSRNGMEWTPFDNAEITINEDGCLVVCSPYVRDPDGFVTGDLADMGEDGRFLLKGRADSVVKIEEKRVSLTEIESRLLGSGLVSEAAVIALQNERRQYTAAVVVLNEQGCARFPLLAEESADKYTADTFFREYLLDFFEPVAVPKRWRYVNALPQDAQGKKKKTEIKALFKGSGV